MPLRNLLPFLMLLFAGASCAAANTARGEVLLNAGLPSLGTLDELRGVAATDITATVSSPLLSLLAAADGTALVLGPDAVDMSYAVYRFQAPVLSELISVSGSASGELWLLVADFEAERWSFTTEFADGTAAAALAGQSGLVSPLGYTYAAIVAPPNQDGRQATLNVLILTVEESPPPGPTYYVAPAADGGDDTNPGTEAEPWATLQHAANEVAAGDTVRVSPGQYAGFMIQTSGTELAPIRFIAEPGAEVISGNEITDDGINIENWEEPPISYVVVEGFTVTGTDRAGIRTAGSENGFAHHITIRGNTCRDNHMWGILSGYVNDLLVEENICSGSVEEHGIYLSNSADRDVCRRNVCYGNSASGIQYNADGELPGDAIMSDGILEYNVLYDNGWDGQNSGGAALNMDGVQDSLIRGNLLYYNHSTGLVLYSGDGLGSQNNVVLNNTIVQNSDINGRWCVTINTDSGGNTLLNNILLNDHNFRGAIDIDSESLVGFVSDYNIVDDRFVVDDGEVMTLDEWRVWSVQDVHSSVHPAGDVFIDATNDDYHIGLLSPARDAGTIHALLPTVDLDGTTRPEGVAIDIGAFELGP